MPLLAALAALLLVGALVVRVRSLARFRRGETTAAPLLLGSTLTVAAVGMGVAGWVVLRSALIGVPLLCGVALLAGLWIRQTGTFIGVDLGAPSDSGGTGPHGPNGSAGVGRQTDRSSWLLAPMVTIARVGSTLLLSVGFAGLVASIIYLLFRSRF